MRGNLQQGSVLAETEELAAAELKQNGFKVEYLEMRSPFLRFLSSMEYLVIEKVVYEFFLDLSARFTKTSPRILAFFMRQLAVLYNSGITLKRSMEIIINESWPRPFYRTLCQVDSGLNLGMAFYETLEQAPRVFGKVITNIIAVGETSGKMTLALEKAAQLTEENARMEQRIASALVYPAFILVTSIIFMGILLANLLPRLNDLMLSFNMKGMWLLETFFAMLRFLSNPITLMLILELVILGILYYLYWIKIPDNRARWDGFLLRVPWLGRFLLNMAMSRLSYNLWLLLDSGVTLLEALQILPGTVGNGKIAQCIEKAKGNIINGIPLSESFETEPLFPCVFINMLKTGEISGNMSSCLAHVTRFYEEETEYSLDSYLKIFEPLVIIILGILVGVMIISFLPLVYELTRDLGKGL